MPPMMPPPNAPGFGPAGAPPRAMHPNVDPSNPFQAQLLMRLRSLSPQDKQALVTGISPAAMAVLAKVLPELSHLIPGGAPKPGAAPGGPPGAGGPPSPQGAGDDEEEEQEQEEAAPPPDGATPLHPAGTQPKSKLANIGA